MAWRSPALAQATVHGADSLFSRPDIKLGWAVDRGPADGKPRVVVRLLNPQGAYRFLRVDGVDPFTMNRAVFVEPQALPAQTEIAIVRDRFVDHPSTEFLLFADEAAMRGRQANADHLLSRRPRHDAGTADDRRCARLSRPHVAPLALLARSRSVRRSRQLSMSTCH